MLCMNIEKTEVLIKNSLIGVGGVAVVAWCLHLLFGIYTSYGVFAVAFATPVVLSIILMPLLLLISIASGVVSWSISDLIKSRQS